MDINNRGMDSGMSSGREVDSAMFHPAVSTMHPVDTSHQLPAADHSSWRHTLDGLKNRGMAKMHSLQHTVSDRSASMKRSLSSSMNSMTASVRDGVSSRKSQLQSTMAVKQSQMQQSMRSNPMLWAGVAGGTGMALGLVGRFLQWRANRPVQHLVVIEAC